MYVVGKSSMVSIVLPRLCTNAIELLVNAENRQMAGVSEDNNFVFAFTEQSVDSIAGYSELRVCCEAIEIPVITTTQMRHRDCTIFWEMEGVAREEITMFLDHIGHKEETSKRIYRELPAVKTLRTMSSILKRMDQVKMSNIFYHQCQEYLSTW